MSRQLNVTQNAEIVKNSKVVVVLPKSTWGGYVTVSDQLGQRQQTWEYNHPCYLVMQDREYGKVMFCGLVNMDWYFVSLSESDKPDTSTPDFSFWSAFWAGVPETVSKLPEKATNYLAELAGATAGVAVKSVLQPSVVILGIVGVIILVGLSQAKKIGIV